MSPLGLLPFLSDFKAQKWQPENMRERTEVPLPGVNVLQALEITAHFSLLI